MDKPKYILFEHIGTEEKPIPPRYISTKRLDISLSKKEIWFQSMIVTDERSYITLKKFMDESKLFDPKIQPHMEYGTFKVIKEGKLLYLNGVNSRKFFKEAIDYLTLKKCDINLIKGLN
ncbi:hypothetical protein [Mucilaginibacter gynuensis]